MDRRKKRTSTKQYMMYINMMEQDPIFASGKIPRDVDVNYLLNKWKELAEQLNTCDNGPTLTAEEWRKRLNDWKNTTRCKYRRSQSGEKDISMTSLELKALDLFGRVPNAATEHLSIQLKCEKDDCEEDIDQQHRTSETFHKELQAAVDEAIGGEDEEEVAVNEHEESDEILPDSLPGTTQVVHASSSNSHNANATTTYRTIVVENAAFADDDHHEEQVEFIAHRRATVATNTQTAAVQTVPTVTKLINGEIPLKRLRTQTSDQIIYEVKKAPTTPQHSQRAYTTTQYTNATPTVITHHYTQPTPPVESVKQEHLSVGGIFSSNDAREIARQLKRLADIKNEKLKFDIARFKFNNPGFQYNFSPL